MYEQSSIHEKEEKDKSLKGIFFMSIKREEEKTFILFEDGTRKEVDKRQMIEMINQLSIALMLEDI